MGIPLSKFHEMQSRLNQFPREVSEKEIGRPVEANLHREIADYCDQNGWIALHGSMAHRTFRTLGEPDFVILRDGGRFLLVECKRPGGKLSREQAGMQHWAARLGHTIHVVHTLKEFIALL